MDGAVTEKYQWLGQTTLVAVYDGADALKWRFEYADGRLPVSAVNGTGNRHYLLFDQVGTLVAVTDASGAVVKALEHDTFGRLLTDSNPGLEIPFGFAGGLADTDTGLVRFGARDYDPEIGRWTALDPIGFAGGDTDLYGYCLNDPVGFVDPWGLQSGAPAIPLIPGAPPIPLPPVFIPGSPANDAFVQSVNDIINALFGDDSSDEDIAPDKNTDAQENDEDPCNDNSKQLKKLLDGEIKKLKKAGENIHKMKNYEKGVDLYKDVTGAIHIRSKKEDVQSLLVIT